jgi:2-methylcitrate dehydratase PrpD
MSPAADTHVASSPAKRGATHVVERFASFAEGFRSRPLAPELLHHAKRSVIDWHAALLPGAVAAPALLLERALEDELDCGAACLALGRRAAVRAAALINGTAAHTAEVDDIFRDGIYHPGAPTISAAFALAQARGASGEAFLRALIVGYEISTRIAATVGRAHYRYWHNTGTIGCFGAASAAAELLGLDAGRFAHALTTVATFSAGLQQAFRMDSMSKPLHAGRAAEAGVTAALAAAEGVIGSLDVLEGEAGFGRAMADDPDWERAFATLGSEFNITRMTFKNHACCGHAFAAIDGALALQAKMHVKPEDIARIRVGGYRATLEVAGMADPATAAEARFSTAYLVATALTHGSVRLAAFDSARLAHPATRELMKKVELSLDAECDAGFPSRRAARVSFELRDGREQTHSQQTRKGDPDDPLSDAELDSKYLELAVPVIGEGRAKALLARLWRLEREPALPFAND